MTYSKKDILTSISFMLFIISFSVVFVVFFKPLYYFDIHHLKLVENTHYTYQQIKENYQILIHYQSIFYQGKLVFKDFIMSKGGRIHFEEVKRIFEMIQIVCLLTFCTTSYLVYRQIKQKEYRFFKLTAILTIVIPLILGFFAFIDFDRLFVMFHQLRDLIYLSICLFHLLLLIYMFFKTLRYKKYNQIKEYTIHDYQ